MEYYYHLVAHIAPFTGLPSILITKKESEASVKAQLALKFMDFGNPKPLICSGIMDYITVKLKRWAKDNDLKFTKFETNDNIGFTVSV